MTNLMTAGFPRGARASCPHRGPQASSLQMRTGSPRSPMQAGGLRSPASVPPAIRLLLILTTLMLPFTPLEANTQLLKSNWSIQSSAEVLDSGIKISTSTFDTRGWYSTEVPATVLAALVKNNVYRDIYFGKNLETISPEPFQTSWWYRKEFDLNPGIARTDTVRLIFDGINYSANVFVNGKQIAFTEDVTGSFRRFDFDISRLVRKKRNVLAVEVFPPKPGDFTIGFVDWNPTPPDRNMGIWREVKLHTAGAVTLENPFVQTKLDLQSFQEARLTVSATLVNHSNRPVSGKMSGEIEKEITFAQNYSLAPNETKEVQFKPEDFSALILKKPRVWWPNNHGNPELYKLHLSIRDVRGISDSREITFGIREVADYFNKEGHRGYVVNGKKILIRGGGWVDELLMREDEKNLEAQMQYAKHLNLNLIRLEGFWGSSEKLYELADRYGILLMAGFSCQWEWKDYLGKEVDEEFGGVLTKEDIDLVTTYLRDQVLWLRNHPSILVWAVASDMLPHPEAERRYRAELSKIDPTRPVLSATKGFTSKLSGPTAVKMNGPYEYVPPNYWYVDKENGGAFGFDTEVSPGAQPPPMESIQRMFAKEHWWPIDDAWNFHSGRNEFNTMQRYLTAFNKRYGPAESLEDFAKRSQAMNYEAIRAMYESFGVRKPVATGVVQWMLNAAWPKMFWQLYDYYLMPGGAFYAARKANRPVNIAYDYAARTVHIVNDTHVDYPNLRAEVKALSLESKEIFGQILKAFAEPNQSKGIVEIPLKEDVLILDLKLKDNDGKVLADNFYWLPKKPDVLDFKATEWFYTPIETHADLTPLNKLPPAAIQVEQQRSNDEIRVTLKNPGKAIAFFIELKVMNEKTGRSILPVLWDDNYVSLLPGETKQLTARFPENLKDENMILQYSGFNVKEVRRRF